ncbi:hypothetical protein Scep_004863 [Stephania cephalantha]|uniref:Retrovirus-related Pol polyprotein from transposon TNT 1-94-like beta-barrel domain-containing protein n=1 Tax=Stephania cephalantha TaxID=152367 RepID=A0AAP0PXP0_9MAGN
MDWYFDSGYSKHMKENVCPFYLTMHHAQMAMSPFGDGVRSKVIWKGILHVQGLPSLKNVLHIEDLKANLLSISQLCDHNLNIQFTKEQCNVYGIYDKIVMKGLRSSDNSYLLQPSKLCAHNTCLQSPRDHRNCFHNSSDQIK